MRYINPRYLLTYLLTYSYMYFLNVKYGVMAEDVSNTMLSVT